MIRIIAFFLLELILVQKIFTLRLCFPEKYKKYEGSFNRAFDKMVGNWHNKLEYGFYQSMEDYIKSLSLYRCDVAMIEPALYDQFYDYVKKINGMNERYVNDTLNNRINDPVDGQIYKELIQDLQVNNRYEAHAFPMFVDYGILYYRKDIEEKQEKPPESWRDLKSMDDYRDEMNYIVSNTIYIGQFNEYREFFYNLFENILNTRDEINYKVAERETYDTINIFKHLFDEEIIDEYAWHLNSEYGVIRFNDKKAFYMRNWSSYLYNVTKAYDNKKKKGDNGRFGIAKTFYNDKSKTAHQSRAINKGIYLCVAESVDQEEVNDAIEVAKIFTDKQFMKLLIEDEEKVFYDIPAYHSLIEEGDEREVDNKDYCERINCEFFREISMDHVIPVYSIFYQNLFLDKISEFFEKAKQFFKSSGDPSEYNEKVGEDKEYITLDGLMSSFSDYFEDKYVEYTRPTTIIIMAIVAVEIVITCAITYYLVKHRNFIEIRRSSPLFLFTMLIGIILAFCSILTFIGKPNKFICMLRPYILVLTFGLTFFSLLLKTFRIKVIFDKTNIQVKDSNLILYLSVILGFQLILVTIWSIIAGMEPVVKVVSKEMHYYVCQNTNNVGKYIQMILIVINGFTLVYGCYLAYKVKNVYSEYNESKVIGLSIYGIVICMIILMFIVNIKGLDHTTLFLIQSLMIILSADIILVFMFTPKLWKLHINIISESPYNKSVNDSINKKSNIEQSNPNNFIIKNRPISNIDDDDEYINEVKPKKVEQEEEEEEEEEQKEEEEEIKEIENEREKGNE